MATNCLKTASDMELLRDKAWARWAAPNKDCVTGFFAEASSTADFPLPVVPAATTGSPFPSILLMASITSSLTLYIPMYLLE